MAMVVLIFKLRRHLRLFDIGSVTIVIGGNKQTFIHGILTKTTGF